jgi:putative FmdB family regulatory protein
LAAKNHAETQTMPIYEYTCQSCQAEAELLIRGSEKPQCPQCGSQRMSRQLSVVAAHSSTAGGSSDAEAPSMCGRPQCGMGGCQGMM